MKIAGTALWALGALAAAALAGPALAHGDPDLGYDDYQESDEPNRRADDEHRWSAYGGLGFGLSPSSFAFGTGLEYHVIHPLSVGPMVQVLAKDDLTIVAATANVRYHFDLSHLESDVASRLEPFVQGGLGLVHVDKDNVGPSRRDRDDTDFLLNGGFGLDYRIDERLSVGTTLMFNGIPGDEAVGEDFFFTWQVVGLRYHF